jgi:hypothetical protein
MELTNKQVHLLYETIAQMRNTLLPTELTFKLTKNFMILEPVYMAIQATREEVLRQHGYTGEPDFQFPEDQVAAINEELIKILEFPNSLGLSTIKLSELQKIESLPISLMEGLYPIVSEEE